MLDSDIKQKKQTNIDWIYIQRLLNRLISRFLNVWIFIMVIAVPLLVVSYGYSSDVIRMFVITAMVGIAWLAWIIRAVVARDLFTWKNSPITWVMLALLAVVIIITIINGISESTILQSNGPLAWIAALGFGLILIQVGVRFPWEEGSMLTKTFTFKRVAYVLVVLYFISAIYPAVISISNNTQHIPLTLSWNRYVNYGQEYFGVFGVGLGRGAEGFWQLAEFVNTSQVKSFPSMNNAYMSILWEGGFVFLVAFVLFGLSIGISSITKANLQLKKLGIKSKGKLHHIKLKRISILFLIWLFALFWIGISFMSLIVLVSLIVVIAHMQVKESDFESKKLWHIKSKPALIFMHVFVFVLVISFVAGAIHTTKSVVSRAQYTKSISQTDNSSILIDTTNLDSAIKIAPWDIWQRVARIEMFVDSLRQLASIEQAVDQYYIINQFKLLESEYVYLLSRARDGKLTGNQLSVLAVQAQRLGDLVNMPKELENSTIPTELRSEQWYQISKNMYQKAITILPRNVVMRTLAAKLYRFQGDDVLGINEEQSTKTENYVEAKKLLDEVFVIDDTYIPAYLEKAVILSRDNKVEEAFELLVPFVDDSPEIAYQAGYLALSLNKFYEAIDYYNISILQDPKNTQAMFELVHSYITVGETEKAKVLLSRLENNMIKDNDERLDQIDDLFELVN
jgi:tetratricopeptide (TPR) repeat protein